MRFTRREALKLSGAGLVGLGTHSSLFGAANAPPKPLRILILGGTGFIGPHQVRYALERGHQVTLFNRGTQRHEWPGKVEELTGDRNTGDLKSLEGGEWDVCIDNPATVPVWVRDAGKTLGGKVKQFIFISTISVYAENNVTADESAATMPYKGKDIMAETMETFQAHFDLYGPLKAASEREAEKQFPGKTTIIRPGLIVGPGDDSDRFTYWPVRLSRGGDVLAPGDGSDPVQIIDARDLAEWTIRMAETRTFGTFNATGPAHELHMDGMLKTIATAIHSDAKLHWVSTEFLEAEKVSAWSDMPVWIPSKGEFAGFGPKASFAGFARRNVNKAIKAGLAFRPLKQTSVDTLAWFKEQPSARQQKLLSGITPEREKELLAKWNEKSVRRSN